MAGVNKVILVGYLGKDPEIRTFASGDSVASFSVATTETFRDKSGNRVDQTEWHNVEIRGVQAKTAEQWLKKGQQVYIEGSIRNESWEDNGVKKYITKIRTFGFTMLGGKSSGNSGEGQEQSASAPTYTKTETAVPKEIVASETDDLPF